MYNFIIGMMLFFLLFPNWGFSTIYYVKSDGDDNAEGASWKTAFQTITKATDIATSGSQVWVKHGTFKEGDTIGIAEGVSCYGGFTGTETDLEQRDQFTTPTIIDGEDLHRCVYNLGSIDGFHVTNGNYHYSRGGGGIYNLYGTISNCDIYSNSASGDGGGINNFVGTVINSTIYSNSASGDGGGINNIYGTITNCMSWKNINSDIVGKRTDISFSCFGEALGENSNMRGNPIFVNTSGAPSTWDLHLQNGSPCIDAGNLEDAPERDIERNPRPGGDGKVCIGAYESPDHYTPSLPLPPIRIFVSKNGNNSNGLSWENSYNSITIALSATSGDDLYEMWVAEGTYQEGCTTIVPGRVYLYGGFVGTETYLEQRDLCTSPTIIDAEELCQCIINYGTIDGFDIINGKFDNKGGGIYNDNGTVTDCSIYSNSTSGLGGGIYNLYGTVNNCYVYSNSGDWSGGIYNDYGIVTNCSIYSNSSYNFGGGISNYFGTVTDCSIYSNYVSGSGGGISNSGTVNNCSVYSNSSDRGGGIYNSSGTITNCSVYSNSASEEVGGIFNDGNGKIVNCISWKNNIGDIVGKYNDINFSCFGEAWEEDGNIRGNPIFVNTSGDPATWDFHLQNGSPCIDAGILKDAPERDIEGNPRPGGDGKVCIGAYESPDHYTPSLPLPPIRIFVSKNGNNSNGNSWEDAYTSITIALLAVSGDDLYEMWVAEGTYKEGITIQIPGRVDFYGGFTGMEASLSERNFSQHHTIIDGGKSYQCITNYGVIDGFHITNGKSESNSGGGGVRNYVGTVTNCNIYSNSSYTFGGGVRNYEGTVINCNIFSNFSSRGGGAINYGTIANSNIYSNFASFDGGGIINVFGDVIKCKIYYNQSSSDGGGIVNLFDSNIYNCILYNNSSSVNIGGIYNSANIFNTTLYNNTGGIENFGIGKVINCISWKNGDFDISGEGTVDRSCFREATGTTGNINQNPMFKNITGDISTWDFHLQDGSPCIDAGYADADYNDACLPPGKAGLRNDMGAFGGPHNCWGEFFMNKGVLIDHLLGRKEINPDYKSCADCNKDTIIDIGDIVQMMLLYPTPTPTPSSP